MPTYNFRCNECGHDFEEFLKISERNNPIDNDCPNCDSRGHIERRIDATPLLYTVDSSLKTTDSFNSRLIDIKNAKGPNRTTIQTRPGLR